MNKSKNSSTKIQILLFISFIIILSCFLRFFRYGDRWGLAYDQAHDALIARYAIASGQLPLVGPFSSAGPFQTSGVWYWFIMIGTLFDRSSVISPWIVLTILYCLLPIGMIAIGTYLWNIRFGLLVGLLTAVSTAQIAQGINLTNQSPLALSSFACLVAFVFYGKTKKLRYLFFLGFFVALSASIHLQGVSLAVLLVSALLVVRFPRFQGILVLILGSCVALLPLVLFEIRHEFVHTSNMIQYVLEDQHKISFDVLGRRWKTFLGQFFPSEWAHVIGGIPQLGMVLMVGGFLSAIFAFGNRDQKKISCGIGIAGIIMIVVLRYTRAPLFSSYLVFLHPFIFFLTGMFLFRLFRVSRLIGVVFLIVVLFFSLIKSIQEIQYGTNLSAQQGNSWSTFLLNTFPETTFSVYVSTFDNDVKTSAVVLSLYLDAKRRVGDGRRIGVVRYPIIDKEVQGKFLLIEDGKAILDLSDQTHDQLLSSGWTRMHGEDLYNRTQYWKF